MDPRAHRFFAIILTLVGASFFVGTLIQAFLYNPDSEIPIPYVVPNEQTIVEQPRRLIIPSIGVDADVQHVGINESGNMMVPSNFTDVGWYKYGVTPGGRGSAVIAGHVDNGLGLSGVFKRLNELQEGDEVLVESAQGSSTRFIVTSSRSYPYTEVPVDILFNQAGSPRLNLITCEGAWVSSEKTYDQRLVVFTRRADVE